MPLAALAVNLAVIAKAPFNAAEATPHSASAIGVVVKAGAMIDNARRLRLPLRRSLRLRGLEFYDDRFLNTRCAARISASLWNSIF
jgi:hypothetical protein